MIGKCVGFDTDLQYVFYVDSDNSVALHFKTDLASVTPSSSANAYSGTGWHHFGVTVAVASSTAIFYRNGTPIPSGTKSFSGTSIVSGTANLNIGRAGTTGFYTKGQLDEIRIFNVARTAAQISTDYQQKISPTTTGLVAYYPFESITVGQPGAFLGFLD